MNKFKNFENKEILVRKTIAGFIEKLFAYHGYGLNHDRVKKVCYNEDAPNSEIEERAKSSYDAFVYLLTNCKSPLTNRIVNTFFYLYFGKAIEESVALRITTRFFDYLDKEPFETASYFHIDVYDELDFCCEEEKLNISLMFFNYVLSKNNIPVLRFLPSEINKYKELKQDFTNGKKELLLEFLFNLVINNKTQDKQYYKNLKKLDVNEIFAILKADESLIKNLFDIKHISIFGSFAKGINRIDSDIDLLMSFSLDLTSDQKQESIKQFKKLYCAKFNRFIDISEISEYLSDEFIKKLPYVKRIF